MMSMKTRYRFRCSDDSYMAVYNIAYNQDGSSDGYTPSDAHQRQYAAPDTIAAGVTALVCGYSEG
jgi:hypothetical protein